VRISTLKSRSESTNGSFASSHRKTPHSQDRKNNSTSRSPELRIIPLPLDAEVRPGAALATLLLNALQRQKQKLVAGDILVLKHKIVSKAEGQFVKLDNIRPSASSCAWALRHNLDPRVIELGLTQSQRIIRRKRGVLITETRHGLVCANSGVDVSNVTAIGVAGMKALHDYRQQRDPHGYTLKATIEAIADELACAAGLVCGKLARTPACIIRGFRYRPGPGSASDLIRPAATDLFR